MPGRCLRRYSRGRPSAHCAPDSDGADTIAAHLPVMDVASGPGHEQTFEWPDSGSLRASRRRRSPRRHPVHLDERLVAVRLDE